MRRGVLPLPSTGHHRVMPAADTKSHLSASPGDTEPAVGVAGQLTGLWLWAFRLPAFGLGVFALWSAGPGIAEDQIHLGIYTLVTWVLALLVLPARKGERWRAPGVFSVSLALVVTICAGVAVMRFDLIADQGLSAMDWVLWLAILALLAATPGLRKSFDLVLIGLSCLAIGYYMMEYREIVDRAGAWTKNDLGMAAIASVIALEVARRALGPWIPCIALGFVGFAYFGEYFPAALSHRGVEIAGIIDYIFYSQEGIFGVMTNVMAQYVLIFIFLGAFMQSSGMGRFFIEMPLSLAGRTAGGPAKVAVLASAIFGSISGSSLANIVSTGTFTIPLMKRVGFRPVVAGAVENTASLGGQLLPPVMGSGVFIMSEITGVPYVEIIAIAAVPALLYLFSIGLMVHFEARKRGIQGLPDLFVGYSPDWSAVMAIVSVVAINWTHRALARAGLIAEREALMGAKAIFDTLVTGTRNSLLIGAVAGAVGIIVGMIALTGLGLKMSLLLVDLSGGSLLLAVFLVALASLLMGMALPITASYLVLVVLAAPALEQLGVALIAAHLIVFWLSQDSNITPPVCLGAFVAAAIARGDPWRTGWMSFRFAKMLYIMPLLFAFTPILDFSDPWRAIWTMATATVGTIAFAAWTLAWFHARTNPAHWLALALAACMCFTPLDAQPAGLVSGYVVNVAGGVLLFAVYFWQRASSSPEPVKQRENP
jgi:TRAP-type uncharacterized transport system fused permease subunit